MSKWVDIIEAVRILGGEDDRPCAERDVIFIAGEPEPDGVPAQNIRRVDLEPDEEDEPAVWLLGNDGRDLHVFWDDEQAFWACFV